MRANSSREMKSGIVMFGWVVVSASVGIEEVRGRARRRVVRIALRVVDCRIFATDCGLVT